VQPPVPPAAQDQPHPPPRVVAPHTETACSAIALCGSESSPHTVV